MKWVIASDIHGSHYYCEKLIKAFEEEKADKLLLLGDLLYHGPRNSLPELYNTKIVADLLNNMKDKIVCVRGNCDAEVDQVMLEFPIMADYTIINDGDLMMFATHGHIYSEYYPPSFLGKGAIILNGHTHIPKCKKHKDKDHDYIYMNPGSVSIPKAGSYHGYMTYENRTFTWKDLDGNIHDMCKV